MVFGLFAVTPVIPSVSVLLIDYLGQQPVACLLVEIIGYSRVIRSVSCTSIRSKGGRCFVAVQQSSFG